MGMTSFYNPPYYNRGKIQVWDFIRDQELNYHLGNVIKYVCRAGHKGDPLEDLDNAIHYLINERDYRRHGSNNHSSPTRNLPEQSSEGVPFNVSRWKFDKSGGQEPSKGADN